MISDLIESLLARTVHQNQSLVSAAPRDLADPTVEQIRRLRGGEIQNLVQTRTEWYLADIESGLTLVRNGNFRLAAQLADACKRDAYYNGLLNVRTAGIVALPKIWRGDPELISRLSSETDSAPLFDEICPSIEIIKMMADGIELGVSIGELVEIEGREHPLLVRLDPQFLRFYPATSEWIFDSVAGPLRITPGDGRWVLHTPGGRLNPWQYGIWPAMGAAYIRKVHAQLARSNYVVKLANPARVAYSPLGSSEVEKAGYLEQIISWGLNSVFELPPGYDVKLLESAGTGHEVFEAEIEASHQEYQVGLTGQLVTTEGGAGFSNTSVGERIQGQLIKASSEGMAHTINSQILPHWALKINPDLQVNELPRVAWDISPPSDLASKADTLTKLGGAVDQLQLTMSSWATQQKANHPDKVVPTLDVLSLFRQFGVPLEVDNVDRYEE